MVTNFKYTNIAFISYKREDEAWAKWLQKKVEHYKLPIEIRKIHPNLEFSECPRHVFKDTTDLSGGVLAKAIKAGLDSSKFLIVICSPRAAKSEWVCKEVQEFIDSGREEYIIPFIIEGEPHAKNKENECFPSTLKSLAGERELLGINVNENGREAASVKVAARMFGLSYDSLWQRFKREEKKRKRSIIAAFILAIIVLLSIIAYGAWMNDCISSERDRINIANKQLFSANQRINKQKDELQKANDSITKQKTDLQVAFDKLSKTEVALLKSNMDLVKSNNNLQKEKLNVLKVNKIILTQRSIEYGNLAYNYIEDGKIPEAEDLLHKIIPDDEDQYVYTPQMERALRRYYNYLDCSVVKLINNKEILGRFVHEYPSFLFQYGFNKRKTICDKEIMTYYNQCKDSVFDVNEEFDNVFLSNDGKIFIGTKYNNIYIYDMNAKCCICKGDLHDEIRAVKFLDDKKICVLGNDYFTIYSYNNYILEIESETKILCPNTLWKQFGDKIPFICDYKGGYIVYQKDDSFLIAQQIGNSRIIYERKIDGVINSIAFNQNNIPCIAITYDTGIDIWHDNGDRLMILHYPSFTFLYERPLYGITLELDYSPMNYLCALVQTSKVGKTQLYLWDVLKPLKYNIRHDYLTQIRNIENNNHIERTDLLMINKGSVIYKKKRKTESNVYDICILEQTSNMVDTLISTNNVNSVQIRTTMDGKYTLYNQIKTGVWLYNSETKEKRTISNKEFDTYGDISISGDGSTVAFRAWNRSSENIITIYNTKNGKIKRYLLKNGNGVNLNYNGTRLMLDDVNNSIYDYNLQSLIYAKVSSPIGSRYTDIFGYSKSGKYLYLIYQDEKYNIENQMKYYIKVLTSDNHELIMENIINDFEPVYIDDVQGFIYQISTLDFKIYHFKQINSLINTFKRKYKNR